MATRVSGAICEFLIIIEKPLVPWEGFREGVINLRFKGLRSVQVYNPINRQSLLWNRVSHLPFVSRAPQGKKPIIVDRLAVSEEQARGLVLSGFYFKDEISPMLEVKYVAQILQPIPIGTLPDYKLGGIYQIYLKSQKPFQFEARVIGSQMTVGMEAKNLSSEALEGSRPSCARDEIQQFFQDCVGSQIHVLVKQFKTTMMFEGIDVEMNSDTLNSIIKKIMEPLTDDLVKFAIQKKRAFEKAPSENNKNKALKLLLRGLGDLYIREIMYAALLSMMRGDVNSKQAEIINDLSDLFLKSVKESCS